MIKQYKKVTPVQRAVQWNGELKTLKDITNLTHYKLELDEDTVILHSPEGDLSLYINDYIVEDVNGGYYPMNKKYFEQHYEENK